MDKEFPEGISVMLLKVFGRVPLVDMDICKWSWKGFLEYRKDSV